MTKRSLVLLVAFLCCSALAAQGITFDVSATMFYSEREAPDPFDWVTISSAHRATVQSYGAMRSFLPWLLQGRLFHADEIAPNVFDRVLQTNSCSRAERHAHSSDGLEYCRTTATNLCVGAVGKWTSRSVAVPIDPSLKSSLTADSSGPVIVRCTDNFPPPPPPDLPGCTDQFQPGYSVLPIGPESISSASAAEAFAGLPEFSEDRNGAFIPTRWKLLRSESRVAGRFDRGLDREVLESSPKHSPPTALVVQHPVHVNNGRGEMPALRSVKPWLPTKYQTSAVTAAFRISFDEDRRRSYETLWSSKPLEIELEQLLTDRIAVRDKKGKMRHRVDAYVVLKIHNGRLEVKEQLMALPQCCCPPGRLICLG